MMDDAKGSEGGMGSVVAQHYNKIEEKGLEERTKSRIYYMRNFNNWVKSMLIAEYLVRIRGPDKPQELYDLTVLDIGCGKGGDLLKWKKGCIKHLICADIAKTSVEQCRDRYREMVHREKYRDRVYTAEFITADCTKERIRDMMKDKNRVVDLVSIQFSFHYCFESLPQVECMLRNVSDNLRVGGFFIGTTPDAYDIVRRVRESPNGHVGNSVYNITLQCNDSPIPLFGAKYNFHLEGVVECPEFLVHFPTLEKLAENYGLHLVYKRRFNNVFTDYSKSETGRQLLQRMQALETYPTTEGDGQACGDGEDYEHARKWIEDHLHSESNPRIGTLSKQEWEAISLYVCFAFKKIIEPPQEETSTKRDSPNTDSEDDDQPRKKRLVRSSSPETKEDSDA